ncbi:MAG: LysR family transcriptional regulator [Vibrio sp.]
MEIEDIYRRDLNLLIALHVLIEEGSVSKAALRLSLSQSAMSRVLGRLRDLFDDPLLIRQGQGLIPTAKALEIHQGLHAPLESMRHLLSPQEFDPATCEQKFYIATTDYAMQTILPYALPRIYREAPKIELEFQPLHHPQINCQLTSLSDFAICRPAGHEGDLHQLPLGQVGVVCLLSKNHPLASKKLTLDDYLDAPHAMIAISDGVKLLLENALSEHPKPKTLLRAYHLESALSIVDQLPLIITVPADLAYLVAKRHDLVIKPLPFEFTPFDYSLLWHERCDHSAPHQWLRNVLKQECGDLIKQRSELVQV